MNTTSHTIPQLVSSTTPVSRTGQMPNLPYDVVSLIFAEATDDTSWDEHPPPIIGYPNSPLSVAITISHVCRDWRMEILANEALWGRLLNTAYFPTADGKGSRSLWWEVFDRSGDKPIWLRHYDRTPHWTCTQTEFHWNRQLKDITMVLDVLLNVSPQRIQRLELDIWNLPTFDRLPKFMTDKIVDAVANYTTHLKLGNSLYASGLTNPKVTLADSADYERFGKETSLSLLQLVFGRQPNRSRKRPLRHLSMYTLNIEVEDLVDILRSCPNLEAASLWIGFEDIFAVSEIPPLRAPPVILCPRLRHFAIERTAEIDWTKLRRWPRNGMRSIAHFDVEAMSKRYCCRASRGLYMIHHVEDIPFPPSLNGTHKHT